MNIELNPRQVGRVLSALRDRERRIKKGLDRFGDNFDPEKGKNLLEGSEAYRQLITIFEGLK